MNLNPSVSFRLRDTELGEEPQAQRDQFRMVPRPRPRQGHGGGVGDPPVGQDEHAVGERKRLIPS